MNNSTLLGLAFNGVDHSTLVNNILSMEPEFWLAERMLGGVHVPSLEAVKALMKSQRNRLHEVTSFKMRSAFERDNVRVFWTYEEKVFCTIPADHVLSPKEWEDFRKQKDFSASYSQNEKHVHEVTCIRETDSSFPSEDFLSYEPEYPLAS